MAEAFKELKENITGKVLTPNEQQFEIARCLHNKEHQALPFLVVQPSCPQDVVLAIQFAKSHDWKVRCTPCFVVSLTDRFRSSLVAILQVVEVF